MPVVRIEALNALAAAIAAAVPPLANRISIVQAPPAATQAYPSLAIVPGPLRYEPQQALFQVALPGDRAVFEVGTHEGPVQLRLLAATLAERYALEDRIYDLLLQRPGAPGVLVLPVSSCPDLGRWISVFIADDEQWIDGRAFDREYEGLLTLQALIPALVTRRGVYTIEQLKLGLTDMSVTDPGDTLSLPGTVTPIQAMPVDTGPAFVAPAVELVTINPDGTISPST